MKKVLRIILIILLVAGGVFAMLPIIRGMKFKNDKLLSCGYSIGGGMLGGRSEISLKTDEKTGEVTLIVKEKETHADREVTTVYKRSPEDFERVRALVNEFNLYNASKKGRSPIEVLDGDTHSVFFDYSKGDFRVSDYQALTRKELKGMHALREYLYSLAQGDGVTTLEPQEARLYLKTGYTFTFFVEAPFDGKLDDILANDFEVYKYGNCGTVINKTEDLDTKDAASVSSASGGDIIYDSETGEIVILYDALETGKEIYLLAKAEYWYQESAAPHIEGMEGSYSMTLN